MPVTPRRRRSALPAFCAVFLSICVLAAGLAGDADDKDKDEENKGLPLEATRTIEFSTDEATWMSLDVSPDGRTLVLELLGDLYTLPAEGGEASTLTTGMAFDSQPRYSPDGEWIAFLSDRDGSENLWIMQADGTDARKLSKDETAEFASPGWSPDGTYVVVSRAGQALGTFEIWMYHVQGGGGIQITKSGSGPEIPRNRRHNALGPVFSPDGRFLYYARKLGGFEYNATFPMWQIARRDMTTGDEDTLTAALGSAIRPLLSPDGKQLIYGTRHDTRTGLRLRDLETGQDRWLAWPVQRDDQESRFTRDLLPGYAFMPDGGELVISYGGKIHRIDIDSGTARPVPFTANIRQELGPRLHFPARVEQGPVHARLIQNATLSPDGKQLALSALTRLYTVALPDGAPRRVTSGMHFEFQPTWSPDGRWLAYVTWSGDTGHIWKTRADGRGKPQQLTTVAAFYTDPVFSPDGERIVALRGLAHEHMRRPVDFGPLPGMDLVWVDADGGIARLIAPARGRGRPHFGPEPDRVYVYSSAGLLSLRMDGTDRREHLKVTGNKPLFGDEPPPADDIRISPDGAWALAHVANQLYLVAVPPLGGEAPTVSINKPSLPVARLTSIGADYFGWANGGDTLTWAIGSTFFRRPRASVSFDDPKDDDKKTDETATSPAVEDPAGGDESVDGDDSTDDDGSSDGEDSSNDNGKNAEAMDADTSDSETEEPPPPEDAPEVERYPVVLQFPRHTPEGDIVLRGARVVTMRGDEVIEDADVVVSRNRIIGIGRRGRVRTPEGAEIFDVSGMTIVPGFIDTHAHWFEIRRGVLDVRNWSFLANLAYGVTAGLDVQTATNDMFAYQDLVDVGEILGPRAFSTGPGIFADNAFKSKEQALGVISRYKEHYRNRHLKSYVVGNRKQRQYVAQAAHELEMMPTTEGALDMKLDLTHAIDGFNGNEHALPIVPLYRDVVELYARSGIGYTPTLLVAYGGPWAENHFYTTTEVHDDVKLNRFMPHNLIDAKSRRRPWFRPDEHVFSRLATEAAKIIRAGGRVGIGSHGQLQGLGYHWEMWALASGGLTPHEVLRAATRHGAEMLGYADDLGSLEPGKLADLVVLAENPLDDIRNTNTVRYVMKNGELFDGDSLDKIWPEKIELAPLWWWDDEPDDLSIH